MDCPNLKYLNENFVENLVSIAFSNLIVSFAVSSVEFSGLKPNLTLKIIAIAINKLDSFRNNFVYFPQLVAEFYAACCRLRFPPPSYSNLKAALL
jgi:hypothetical protein